MAPAVGISVAIGATLMAAVAVDVTKRQERELLSERANEVAALLTTTMSETRSVLVVAGASATQPASSALFTQVTAPSAASGANVVVLDRRAGRFVVVAHAGTTAPAIGTTPDPAVDAVASRALTRPDMVSGVTGTGSTRHLILAMAGSGGRVAYLDSRVNTTTPTQSDPNSPYRELNGAMYAADTPAPGQLILVSGKIPTSHQDVVDKPFKVGSDTWLLQVASAKPLVGSLAGAFAWLLFGGGILSAIILALLIETLVRRRAYALRLVDERTRSLREAQATAERANNAKSEFLSRMSHELRTPLNAVLGFAQLLDMDALTPDQSENVSQITKGGSHLLDLINEILDISQIESGRMSLSPEPVLVSEVIDAAVRLVRPLAEERSVHLIALPAQEQERFVIADRQRLKQILLNLLSNGIKYNRPGGSVSISLVEPAAGSLRIQVGDTGLGVAPDKLHLLFAPFERLGAEHTSIQGTGVGLALSRGLAEAMGGTLGVESTPNRGSTFWVELPLVENPVDAHEVAAVGAVAPERDDTLLVLHIEDNPANVALVERVLAQRPEVTLIPALQGRMGLDLARRHRPILILLDLNLADLPGTEVLSALRADPVTAAIPVVVVSADAMPRQIQRVLSGGAVAYLSKPIDIRQLLMLVDDAIAGAFDRSHVAAGSTAGRTRGSELG